MRDYQIKMEPFDFIAIREFRILQEPGNHGTAKIAVRIKDELKERYMETLISETWVRLLAVDKEEKEAVYTVLFHGIVTDFSFTQDGYETIMELEIKSGTILMDLKPHFRVFQNEEALCASLHQKIAETYPAGAAVPLEGGQDQTMGVLVQYQETDWEFLKRLAARCGHCLTPIALGKECRYTIGLPKGRKRQAETGRIRMRLDTGEYMEKSRNGMPALQPGDLLELVLTDREIFQTGDFIEYQGKNYFIYKILTTYQGAECCHEYTLRTKEGLKVLPLLHKEATGCSFDGVVSAVTRDKVQVEIQGDEWKGADGKKWFLYSTVYSSPDGAGWYCMPEAGDSVRLYVPEKEEDSFVISAVHRETDSARQNPDYKSLKTKYGKEILFTPDSILMTNHQGMMLEMNDNEGITITSDKDIVIQAEENLTVASSSAALLIAAEDKVQVKQGGTTMTLSGDISFTGGEFRIQ